MPKTTGVLGYFDGPKAIILGARAMRKKHQFRKWDAFTPFAVHTLDEAMGIPRSRLPWIVLLGGASGLSFGTFLQVWTSAYDYPLFVGGKPLISWPAFIPVMFELTVLISAFANLGGMLFLCGLPFGRKKILDPGFTDDKFALFVPSNEEGFDAAALEKAFREAGAVSVRLVEEND